MNHGWASHTEQDDLSTAMRLLIHYVGDVHQPLHGTSRVNHDYEAGDRGGNNVPLPDQATVNNLHELWDSAVYKFAGYQNLPFSDADWSDEGDYVNELMAKYKMDDDKVAETDVHK